MKRILTIVTAALVVSCATPPPEYPMEGGGEGGPRPSWVDGRAQRYPEMQYLTGVGSGAERAPCESDARAALAKIFKAHVEQVSRDWQGHFSKVNELGKVHVEAMELSQLTQVTTDYVLRGSQIVEVWHGPDAYHCLAALERMPAARTLRDEIDRLDVEITNAVTQGDQGANDTARFFAYKRAMEVLERREALNAELRIVDPMGNGRPPTHGWEELVAKFTNTRDKIKVGLKLTGRDANRLQTCVAEQLGNRDIRVMENTSDIDLMIHGEMSWNWAGEVNGSYLVKVKVNVRLTDLEGGKTLAAFAEELKTGRPQKEMALQTASTKLCLKLAPVLAEKINTALTR